MAYVKLAIFAVFLLTAFLIFPMKNAKESCPVVGRHCSFSQYVEGTPCGNGCRCKPWTMGLCGLQILGTGPASRHGASQIGGCMILLQTWTWTRMPFIAPISRHQVNFPLARMWCEPGHNYLKSPLHKVFDYRSHIDHMFKADFTWRPFLLLNHQPQLAQSWIWSATTFMICLEVVEIHQTD
ncbi:unnamed protein product [Trifolium pratense]|uniref:Uncharacterized protein n=1 Tax=Trifolium pratense TaxID=57577 RepID=A0ACB0MEL7_TRIPR|nr:unnamed protein product [Trifolium pratense]